MPLLCYLKSYWPVLLAWQAYRMLTAEVGLLDAVLRRAQDAIRQNHTRIKLNKCFIH